MRKILYSIILCGFFSNGLLAQTQKISFEASEGYNLATIVGQKGWTVKTDMANSFFKVIDGNASDGNRSVEVKSNGVFNENYSYLEKKIDYYDKVSISADVKLEGLEGSEYYMLSLYAANKWAGGFNFAFGGEIVADSNVTAKYLGDWEPNRWYNTKIIINHIAKTVDYYLDGVWVFQSPFNTDVTKVDEVDFEFDNYETGFVVDNLIVENLTNMAVSDVDKTQISIYPNPTSNWVNIKADSKIEVINIYDSKGSLIKQENYNSSEVNINISDLPIGNYLITGNTTTGSFTKKIIKS